MERPIPWGISSLLPLVVFPVLGVMSIRATTALYGQRLFFWILGITMLGYALEKHGLAKRVALRFLILKGVANSTARLTFMYMLAAAIISMFIANVGVVGMMMPIGMSLFAYISEVTGLAREGEKKSRLASFLALGTLYERCTDLGGPAGRSVPEVFASILGTLTPIPVERMTERETDPDDHIADDFFGYYSGKLDKLERQLRA